MNDAIVVGAGIVGAACAYWLAKDGLKVTVLDAGGIGCGTTAAGMGHIVVMDDSPAQWALTKYSRDLWRELKQEMPPECEYVETGTLWVAEDEGEMDYVRQKAGAHTSAGVEAEILDADALGDAEPSLRPGLAGALRVPGDGVLYPPTSAAWLLKQSGASLQLHTAVAAVSSGTVCTERGNELSAGVIVNAAGYAASVLTPGLTVRPRKGHLAITDRYAGSVHHQIVELGYLKSAHGTTEDSVAFNVQPRATGQLLIGSSRQYGSDDPQVDQGILTRMIERAKLYMPSLGRMNCIRVWTGLRPATPDKLPYIGPCVDQPGVYAAAGHEGLGIATSLATGRLIADHVMGRSSAIDRSPYLPSRVHA